MPSSFFRRILISLVFAVSVGAFLVPSIASAETYQCTCLNVPAQDCSAEASMVLTGLTIESATPPAADNPANCTAKCASPGAICDVCRQCITACQSTGKTCQLWWQKGQINVIPPKTYIELPNPLKAESVPELISNILKAGMEIVGALALLVFIYGGFIWLTSGGDSGKVSAGKEAMKWAAVGLLVIFTSYGLVSFVFSAITG
ncbi:MAG: pilin [Patescibacteria group bacterium]|jgi:hypothetical protein